MPFLSDSFLASLPPCLPLFVFPALSCCVSTCSAIRSRTWSIVSFVTTLTRPPSAFSAFVFEHQFPSSCLTARVHRAFTTSTTVRPVQDLSAAITFSCLFFSFFSRVAVDSQLRHVNPLALKNALQRDVTKPRAQPGKKKTDKKRR